MKASVLGLAIASVAFGASTIYLATQLQEERAAADALATQTNALKARIAELERAGTGRRFASDRSFENVAMTPGPKPAGPPPGLAAEGEITADSGRVVMNGPPPPRSEAFQKMMRSQMRASNKRLYGDLTKQLGLTKDTANKLVDLLTDQQMDGFTRAREISDPEERHRVVEETRRDQQAQITDLIGADKAQSLEEFQQTIPARQELEALSRQLESSDSSLNEDQRNRMLNVLVEERKRIPMPKLSDAATPEEYTKAYSEWQADYAERVSSQARGILSSEQLTAYDEYQQWQQEMRTQMAVRRAGRGPRGAAGPDVMFTIATPVGAEVVTSPAPTEKPRKAQ